MDGGSGRKRILAIDGGGLRCLMAIAVLAELEQRLAASSGSAGFRLHQHFDLVAGTSGGALIAAAIAAGRSMSELQDFVLANTKSLFKPARPHRLWIGRFDRSDMADRLKEFLGPERTLGSPDLKAVLLMVLHNVTTDAAWVVSNGPASPYNHSARDDCNLELPLWQVARASAAAPTFYPAERIRLGRSKPREYVFVDGGVTGYNNPSFMAFLYATSSPYGLNWSAGEGAMSLLSLGSGVVRRRNDGIGPWGLNLWFHARKAAFGVIAASDRSQDLICRTLGRCRQVTPLESSIGDMRSARTCAEPRMFDYYRINPVLSREGLASIGCADVDPFAISKFDNTDATNAYLKVGRAMASWGLGTYLADQEGTPQPPPAYDAAR